jgi:hypothetical protein
MYISYSKLLDLFYPQMRQEVQIRRSQPMREVTYSSLLLRHQSSSKMEMDPSLEFFVLSQIYE